MRPRFSAPPHGPRASISIFRVFAASGRTLGHQLLIGAQALIGIRHNSHSVLGKFNRDSSPTRTYYDYRSDTVTIPSDAMLRFGIQAQVGDDVYGEDEPTRELEDLMARLCGKEAGLFVCSGTMGNQIALRAHLDRPPYSVLVDARSHIYRWEAGGGAMLSGAHLLPIQPHSEPRRPSQPQQPPSQFKDIPKSDRQLGSLSPSSPYKSPITPSSHLIPAQILSSVIPDTDVHTPPTRLVCLENPLDGVIFRDLEGLKSLALELSDKGIPLHIDYARIWNLVSSGVNIEQLKTKTQPQHQQDSSFPSLLPWTSPATTLTICFSKALSCPVGSILLGPKDFIARARRIRKVFGGGWRQSGYLANMALWGIKNLGPSLRDQHTATTLLHDKLKSLNVKISKPVDTNMIFLSVADLGLSLQGLEPFMLSRGFKVFTMNDFEMRLVVHKDNSESVAQFSETFAEWLRK